MIKSIEIGLTSLYNVGLESIISYFFFIALIPVICLMVPLGVLKVTGHRATPITFVTTFSFAVIVWKVPVLDAFKASFKGTANTLWPIILVIMEAVFIYNLSLHTKSMNVIKNMMTGITKIKGYWF